MVNEVIRHIVLEEYPEIRAPFSGSLRSSIGRMGLGNPHRATKLELVDLIVHESIHSLLYMLERDVRFYLVDPGIHGFQSPWSGRLLTLHSYTHACFVWYGLAHFWSAAGCQEEARLLLRRALSGFAQDDLVKPIRNFVTEEVVATISGMQETMRKAS